MSDDFSSLEKILFLVSTLMTGGVGAQEWARRRHERVHEMLDQKVSALAEQAPKTYRAKDDCSDICERLESGFEKTVLRIEANIKTAQEEYRGDLRRMYDKLEKKEDKH